MRSVDRNKPAALSFLLELESSGIGGSDVGFINEDGMSAPLMACFHPNTDCLDLLSSAGVDFRAWPTMPPSYGGSTPLMVASQMGRVAIVNKLCQMGVDAHCKNTATGITALETAQGTLQWIAANAEHAETILSTATMKAPTIDDLNACVALLTATMQQQAATAGASGAGAGALAGAGVPVGSKRPVAE
jgi:ankyrin repeat protein